MRMFMRYWLQGDYKGAAKYGYKVYLKTNDLQKAIKKMEHSTKKVFIWDCIKRVLVDANYDCHITSL